MSQRTEALAVSQARAQERIRTISAEIKECTKWLNNRAADEEPVNIEAGLSALGGMVRALTAAFDERKELAEKMAAEIDRLEQERITDQPVASDYSRWADSPMRFVI